uniref:Uncharacterized protein n=1 Tax=Bos indicus x Bos taurus TaxID=30522 RepID=A0A4W2GKB7_BOBOX
RPPGPHRLLRRCLLLPLLLRVAVVGQVAAAVGRAPAELELAVGRQRVVGRVLLVVWRRARLVGGRRRPGVLRRRLEAAAAAGALWPHLPLQPGPAKRVVVLGRGARRAAHQARQVRVVRRPPARGAVGPAAVRVGQWLPAAAPRPIVLLQRAVLVEAPVRPRLRALEAAPASEVLLVAVRPAGPRAVGVGKGRELIHGDGRHPGGEVLPGQHLRFGALCYRGIGHTKPNTHLVPSHSLFQFPQLKLGGH